MNETWVWRFFCFATLEALMQTTEISGTKQSSSLLRKQKLVVKWDYPCLNGEVSKWRGLFRGSPYRHWEEKSTSRQCTACLPVMDLWQNWILSGQPRWDESQCFKTDIAKDKCLHFPAIQKWTGDTFLLNRTGESWERASLPNNHIFSFKNKNKFKMSGLGWTST